MSDYLLICRECSYRQKHNLGCNCAGEKKKMKFTCRCCAKEIESIKIPDDWVRIVRVKEFIFCSKECQDKIIPTIEEIRKWRKERSDKKLPCGLDDFYRENNICFNCSAGVHPYDFYKLACPCLICGE